MKVPVRFLIDECRNIGKIPNLSIYLATCRKYRITIAPIFQNYSQIEELYGKEGANSIVSNCDAFLFLGGSDKSTLEIIQGHLGKETVKTLSNSMAQTSKGSNSATKQQTGKDLMTRDQIETMSNAECLLFIRALRPFKTKKYDLNRHPNYVYLNEGKKGRAYPNPFSIAYEDDAIEENRVKTADEEGYIRPQQVDSARRRTLIATNKKKAEECRAMLDEMQSRLDNANNPEERENIEEGIAFVKQQLEKLNRTDPDNNKESGHPSQTDAASMQACNETKSAEQYERDRNSYDVPQTNGSLRDVIYTQKVGSFTPEHEFDPVKDFSMEAFLAKADNVSDDADYIENGAASHEEEPYFDEEPPADDAM